MVKQMLYAIKNKDDLEILNELASLQNQVKNLGLQGQPGNRNLQEDIKNYLNRLQIRLERVLNIKVKPLKIQPRQLN